MCSSHFASDVQWLMRRERDGSLLARHRLMREQSKQLRELVAHLAPVDDHVDRALLSRNSER